MIASRHLVLFFLGSPKKFSNPSYLSRRLALSNHRSQSIEIARTRSRSSPSCPSVLLSFCPFVCFCLPLPFVCRNAFSSGLADPGKGWMSSALFLGSLSHFDTTRESVSAPPPASSLIAAILNTAADWRYRSFFGVPSKSTTSNPCQRIQVRKTNFDLVSAFPYHARDIRIRKYNSGAELLHGAGLSPPGSVVRNGRQRCRTLRWELENLGRALGTGMCGAPEKSAKSEKSGHPARGPGFSVHRSKPYH